MGQRGRTECRGPTGKYGGSAGDKNHTGKTVPSRQGPQWVPAPPYKPFISFKERKNKNKTLSFAQWRHWRLAWGVPVTILEGQPATVRPRHITLGTTGHLRITAATTQLRVKDLLFREGEGR